MLASKKPILGLDMPLDKPNHFNNYILLSWRQIDIMTIIGIDDLSSNAGQGCLSFTLY